MHGCWRQRERDCGGGGRGEEKGGDREIKCRQMTAGARGSKGGQEIQKDRENREINKQ